MFYNFIYYKTNYYNNKKKMNPSFTLPNWIKLGSHIRFDGGATACPQIGTVKEISILRDDDPIEYAICIVGPMAEGDSTPSPTASTFSWIRITYDYDLDLLSQEEEVKDPEEDIGLCGSCKIQLDHLRDGTEEDGHRCHNCYWTEEGLDKGVELITPDYRNIK